MTEVVVTTADIRSAMLQLNHHQQTNTHCLTGRTPFLSSSQQCQPTVPEHWKKKKYISHSTELLTPSSPGVFPTLSLTTKGSRLPWGRVAMPLISPLFPVPHRATEIYVQILTSGRDSSNRKIWWQRWWWRWWWWPSVMKFHSTPNLGHLHAAWPIDFYLLQETLNSSEESLTVRFVPPFDDPLLSADKQLHCLFKITINWRATWKNRIHWYISFFRSSLNRVLFLMFCLLVEGECQI